MMQQSLALPRVAQFHLAGTTFTSAGGEGRGRRGKGGVVCLKHGQHMWSVLDMSNDVLLCVKGWRWTSL